MNHTLLRHVQFQKPVVLVYNRKFVVTFIRHYINNQSIHKKVNFPSKSDFVTLYTDCHSKTSFSNSLQHSDVLSHAQLLNNSGVLSKKSNESKIVSKSYRFHGRVREFTVQLNILKLTCDILNQVLNGEPIDIHSEEIPLVEINLIVAILKRKLGGNQKNSKRKVFDKICDLKTISRKSKKPFINSEENSCILKFKEFQRLLDQLKNSESVKRVEENNKFVCKHTNAFLYAKFVNKNKLDFNKDSENLFYKYYFEEFAQNNKLSLDVFYDPARNGVRSNKDQKSLNTEYLLRMLSCQKYQKDFFDYLETDFVNDYLSAVYKKLSRLLIPLDCELQNIIEKDYPTAVSKFISSKIESKWCKIPWSSKEVILAKNHFLDYFNKLLHLLKYYDLKTVVKFTLHPNIFESQFAQLVRLELDLIPHIESNKLEYSHEESAVLDEKFLMENKP